MESVIIVKDVGVQPSVKNVVTSPELELFHRMSFYVTRDFSVSFNNPSKHARVPYQSPEGSGQTDNEL
jgi:hypothetical protein